MVRTVSLKNFDFASHTDRGKIRDRNEDFLAYFDTINGHVFVVCDGMGGHSAGDVASELAVESVGNFFKEKYYENPFEAIEEAMLYANQMVYNHSIGNDYLNGMGTTIVLVLIRDDKVYYGHAGDSRLYLYKNNILDQITTDHSHVQQLLSKGLITKKEAKEHPLKNKITCALGLSPKFEPEVSPKAIIPQDNDILLLCTDGLTNMLDDQEIASVLENLYNLNDKATKLISKANKQGGIDNISIQIIRFHNLNFAEEPEENKSKPVFETLRNTLKKKHLAYLLVALFILGTSFFMGLYERPKVVFNSNQDEIDYDTDLIYAYFIKPGDNLKNLAERFNVDEELLKRLNPNFDKIKEGMHLKVPIRNLHIVQQVDELPLIVARYDSDIIDIMKANDLCSKYLVIGSEIIIPVKSKKDN